MSRQDVYQLIAKQREAGMSNSTLKATYPLELITQFSFL